MTIYIDLDGILELLAAVPWWACAAAYLTAAYGYAYRVLPRIHHWIVFDSPEALDLPTTVVVFLAAPVWVVALLAWLVVSVVLWPITARAKSGVKS